MTRNILIAMTGGVAAYKVCEVISTLAKNGDAVRCILTDSAQQFITPLTVATLCRHPAYTDADFWQATHQRPLHIELGEWADVIAIAPLTANTLAKLNYGLADNLLTNTVLASVCPILIAPAMNTDMWEQPTVQRNWQELLKIERYHAIAPSSGILACDRVGAGRMAEPSEILTYIESLLYTKGKRDLQGKNILISGGGTREYLDAVRYIGNPATGKMGIALANSAYQRGANVILVHTEKIDLPGIENITAVSADEMLEAMLQYFPLADITVMAAAVADMKPAMRSTVKLAKKDLPNNLPLTFVTDIVEKLSHLKQPGQYLVGFAAQTGDIITPALEKLQRKNLDMIVANPIDQVNTGFAAETNQAVFLDKAGDRLNIPLCSKLELAHRLWDFVLGQSPFSEKYSTPPGQ